MSASPNSLIKVAMLGLNRAPLPEKLGLLGLEAPILGEKPEARLLEAAGFQSLAKKVGFQTIKPETEHQLQQAEDEDFPYISYQANNCLKQILNGNNQLLLEEFLQLTQASNCIISPEHLPKLFQWIRVMKLPRELYLPIIGKRGYWLANLREEWRSLLPPKAEAWQYGSTEERVDWLDSLRKQGPQQARALLQAEWKHCTYKELAKMVPVLQTSLSLEDEELLIQLAQHRRKEVRQAAKTLLSQLPAGQIVQRMQAYVPFFLQMDSNSLVLNFPESLSEEMLADGLGDDLPIASGLTGEKGKWLINLLSKIPPAHWEQAWDRSPQNSLEWILPQEWAQQIILGLTFATITFRNPDWALALVQASLLEGAPCHSILSPPLLEELLLICDSQELYAWLADAIQKSNQAEELAQLFIALPQHKHHIQEDLAWIFAQKLAGLLHQRTQHPYTLRAFVYQLSDLSYFLPATLYPRIAACWKKADDKEEDWYEKHLEMALQILEFRYQMNGHDPITPAC